MNTCETCKAFDAEHHICRVHAPVFHIGIQGGVFPAVHALDWCLEWRSKEKKEPVKRDVKERGITVEFYISAMGNAGPVSDKHRAFAKTLGIDVGPEWGKFKNYCLAHGKRYINFEAAFRNWLANSVNMNGGKR